MTDGRTGRAPATRVVADGQQVLERHETTLEQPARPPVLPSARPSCIRCNFEVHSTARGCKNPCPNCGMMYPLGDCSD
jgi:hypothetical protein